MIVLVMGVCGVGKSTVGHRLARELGARFIEGDEYHPPENIAKMRRGEPLDDADRAGWLEALHMELTAVTQSGGSAVLACSALKEAYRRRLLTIDGADSHIVFLKAPRDLLQARLRRRQDHFMAPGLLDSQQAILEPPQDAVTIDTTAPQETIVTMALNALRARHERPHDDEL